MKRVWKVFTFAGWWLVFLGVAVSLLFGVSYVESRLAAVVLAAIGFILAVIGEFGLVKHLDKKHRYIWEALSLSGIFCLSAGLLWIAYIFVVEQYMLGIVGLFVLGIILIYVGETKVKLWELSEKKKK